MNTNHESNHDCIDTNVLLTRIIDGDLPQDRQERLERHLAECRDCRDLVEQAESADMAMAAIAESGRYMPDALQDRVLARLDPSTGGRRGNRLAVIALAAMLIFSITVSTWLLSPGGRGMNNPFSSFANDWNYPVDQLAFSGVLNPGSSSMINVGQAGGRLDEQALAQCATVLELVREMSPDDEQELEWIRSIIEYDQLRQRLDRLRISSMHEQLLVDTTGWLIDRTMATSMQPTEIRMLKELIERTEITGQLNRMAGIESRDGRI